MPFDHNAAVRHPRYRSGQVLLDQGDTVVVHFEHGVEICLAADLELVQGSAERIVARRIDPALHVVTRILGECIRSVHDAWGVFSRSRIKLLPHQLWVCKRVLESWPTRWLVADDVGLGKTIEAGLILTALKERVRRVLILAPASLVEQWQERLQDMFEIAFNIYATDSDTKTSNYWNNNHGVIASVHTLRRDTDGRWERICNADPWDLVLIDEAHHMNVDERGHRTLSYQLVERLHGRGKVKSLVLFTGTPHRGKDTGFLSLLKLLRPKDFDLDDPLEKQVGKLRTVMIRNNKQSVTDMAGQPLFTPVRTRPETYHYSPQEARFYELLERFIVTGKIYAAGLGSRDQRTVNLTLITMQKLASSSVAAVRRALDRRLARLRDAGRRDHGRNQAGWQTIDEDYPANLDEVSRLEEQEAANWRGVHLNRNEIPAIEELLAAANEVTDETKIERILTVVDESFADRSVLFFTEYKATQALLMSALHERYGDRCVTFINGDGFIDNVRDSTGNVSRRTEDRRRAAQRFNRGRVRFLVSTEAAGEGVDLQEHCSALIHVDLPWNPMRLHQRVGRLSRYGQADPVDVVTVRNPDTVESRIWDLLDEKLARIDLAYQGSMDDPEDVRHLVLGMAPRRTFTKLFADADPAMKGQALKDWFDVETATFGGEDAVNTVHNLVGHVARFDFGAVAGQIPKVDLPDLVPFFKAILAVRRRRPEQMEDLRLSFRPPKEWQDDDDFAIVVDRYDLLFARETATRDGEYVAGIGLPVVERAVRDAVDLPEAFGAIRGLDAPIFVFSVRDRITGSDGSRGAVVVAAQSGGDGAWTLVRDWELMKRLNPLADKPRSQAFRDADPAYDAVDLMADARQYVESRIHTLELPFKVPAVESLACLVPGEATTQAAPQGRTRRRRQR